MGCLSLSWVQKEPPSLHTEREGGQGVVCRAHSCANLGRWVSANLQEEPPSLCTEREGRRVLSWLFIRLSRMRVCLLRPPRGRAWVAGPRHICRKSSVASAQSKRAVRSSPGFLYDPRATFLFRRRGLFAETPSRASLGRWVSVRFAGRALEPLHEAGGRSGVPIAFYTPLAREGLFVETPSSASLGRGVSAYLQEELPSLCPEQEGR